MLWVEPGQRSVGFGAALLRCSKRANAGPLRWALTLHDLPASTGRLKASTRVTATRVLVVCMTTRRVTNACS